MDAVQSVLRLIDRRRGAIYYPVPGGPYLIDIARGMDFNMNSGSVVEVWGYPLLSVIRGGESWAELVAELNEDLVVRLGDRRHCAGKGCLHWEAHRRFARIRLLNEYQTVLQCLFRRLDSQLAQ